MPPYTSSSGLLAAFALPLLLSCQAANGIEWLGIANLERPSDLLLSDSKMMRLYSFNQQRIAQLRNNPGSVQHLHEASRMTVEACRESFVDSRWNCSSVRQLPEVSMELALGTREQAYVYGIASAMLTYWFAQACACGCRRKNEIIRAAKRDAADFQWSGACNARIDYALKFSERFTESQLKRSGKQPASFGEPAGAALSREVAALINSHNSRIGRQVARDSKTTMCRCQGVSGSCTVKACVHEVDKAKVIETMKEKYSKAVRLAKKLTIAAVFAELQNVKADLTFLELSPDYCLPDPTRGSQGTRDRICGDGTRNNCDTLCCRRGYRTRFHLKDDKCNCRYLWCCSVECDQCTRNVTEHVCN